MIIFFNEQKQILCCPGPNIEEKLSTNDSTQASEGRYIMIFCIIKIRNEVAFMHGCSM